MKTFLIIFAILGGIFYGSYLSGNGNQVVSAIHEAEISSTKVIPVVNAQEKMVRQSSPQVEPKVEDILYEIGRVFGKEGIGVVKKALDCFYAESKWNYKAVHVNSDGSVDRGVTQLNSVHKLRSDEWFDYKVNIEKAYEIYKQRGWSGWYANGCK